MSGPRRRSPVADRELGPRSPEGPDRTGRRQRRAALVVGLLLLAALAAVLAVDTPWRLLADAPPVPADPALDFTAAERARSAAVADRLHGWQWTATGLGLAAAAVLGLTRAGARAIALAAGPLGGGWVARAAVAGLVVGLLVRLARLPASVAVEAVRRDVGLSTRSWPEYAADWLRGLGVTAVSLAVVLVIGYGLVRRSRRRWWLPLAGATAAMVVAGSFVYPLVVEPVFNRFTPLPAGPLREDLLALAERRGVAVGDVLVADASRRTTGLNAHVSGFGASARLVLHDTLLAGASDDEVRAVVAHELAHTAEGDVVAGTLQGALGAAAAVCLAYAALGPADRGRGPRLVHRAGADDLGDPRSAALVLLAVTVGSLLVAPVTTAVSRRVEARADLGAVELTRDPAALVDLHRRLAVVNLADLDPSLPRRLLVATHPSAPERIAAARRWALAEGVPVPAPRALDPAGPGVPGAPLPVR